MAESTRDTRLHPATMGFSAMVYAGRVSLQVGETRFHTLEETLIHESAYFAAQLPSLLSTYHLFFIDADPGLFKHILNYLRTRTFPVFFDTATQTFDLAKYQALLGEARFFGIPKLEAWIKEEKYLDVVDIKKSTTIVSDAEDMTELLQRAAKTNTRVDVHATWGSKRVYVCPRDIFVHRGDRARCGQACEKARERLGCGIDYEEEPVLRAVVTTTKVSLNPAACMRDEPDVTESL
ncbi:hypothetical protein F4779DRAFT_567502 [Xylariaceae sp. FL0662B]|nr:hypothetical protein F4779DRAFT_567502 [Xylariaceae sp. FL0662B]